MGDVTSIKPEQVEPDETVIRILEDILEDAKEGKILEFVFVGRMRAGDSLYGQAGERNSIYEMQGMLDDASKRYWAEVNFIGGE